MTAILRPRIIAQSEIAGGAENYLVKLYAKLRPHISEPILLGELPGWSDHGLPFVDAGLGPKWGSETIARGFIRLPGESRRVQRLCRDQMISYFHMQFKREQIGFTSALARLAPVVWTEHGRFLSGRRGRALAAAYRHAAHNVAAIICVSDVVAADVERITPLRTRVEVIPNAIDVVRNAPPTPTAKLDARRVLGLPLDGHVCCWVGTVRAGKLPMLAAEVAVRFEGHSVIAGHGSEFDQLHAAVAGAERVSLLGHIQDPGIIYRASDVFLFTSNGEGEGFPTTLLEAAAHGLPIAANDGCGFEAMVRSAGGDCAVAEPVALARLAKRLSREPDRTTRARNWAARHDIESWAQAHLDLFTDVVAGSTPTRRQDFGGHNDD